MPDRNKSLQEGVIHVASGMSHLDHADMANTEKGQSNDELELRIRPAPPTRAAMPMTSKRQTKIAFWGLGAMGARMAARLMSEDTDLKVWSRSGLPQGF